MRRPGSNHVTEAFADSSCPGGLIRPSRLAKAKRESPFSLRLSFEEKSRLKAAAGNLSLGAYIKARLFEGLPAVPRQNAASKIDRKALGSLLSMLGDSRLASNMSQIAHAANIGTLPVDEEMIADLNKACADIRLMRRALLKALGQRAPKL